MRGSATKQPRQHLAKLVVLALVLLARGAFGGCPFALLSSSSSSAPASASRPVGDDDGGAGPLRRPSRHLMASEVEPGNGASAVGSVPDGGFEAVAADLEALFTDSQEFWPADFGNYGPFFIRLAWHCAGSYRSTDGRGGCDGGRIRFDPELTWMDNANIDKALELLGPIKAKYGSTLSWGDLIVLSGTIAIRSMGAPILGFCGGRVDDADGTDSLMLGPSPDQEMLSPCEVNGQCEAPLGPTTIGLIYVNPEGPMGNPDPLDSADAIASSFGRMGLNDSETVAFIGGGHAFGKCHGACPDPPCGDGKGNNTYTSGIEGAWTSAPTTWTNQYFTNLMDYTWNVTTGPGGLYQWEPFTLSGDEGPDVIMLTTDVALKESAKYGPYVEAWASDIVPLEEAFAAVWYKVTSSDMGPHVRCMGDMVPPAQDFQGILPPPPDSAPDYQAVTEQIDSLISSDPANAAAFVRLAWHCASTYRATDHKGGCNGARIRFPPESEWPENAGSAETLAVLAPIYEAHPDLSWADLIVLAGTRSVQTGGASNVLFCPGRVDAMESNYSSDLAPRYYSPLTVQLQDDAIVKGLGPQEYVALVGLMAMANQSSTPVVTNGLFSNLSIDTFGSASPLQRALLGSQDFANTVLEYAINEDAYKQNLALGWTKLMNADRYGANCSLPEVGAMGVTEPTYGPNDDSAAGAEAVHTYFAAAVVASLSAILLA